MKISSVNKLIGDIWLPGDKSVSHRAAIVSSLAEGKVRIKNFATSADCSSTIECLRRLGVAIERNGSDVVVKGVGKQGFSKPDKPLDCGNSGTTMRLLAGVLAGQDFESILVGDESLQSRPMKRIIEPLELMGAKIDSNEGKAPLKICGQARLKAIDYVLPVASAQIKSCATLAGLNADGVLRIRNPKSKFKTPPSRNHTELMLDYFEANIDEEFVSIDNSFIHEISIDGDSVLVSKDIEVPADISSAAFFLVAAGCLEGSELFLRNVGVNKTRSAVVDVLKRFGVVIEPEDRRQRNGEDFADLRVKGEKRSESKAGLNLIRGDIIANLIDEIPILAVFGTQIEGGLLVRDATELRVKESDRIAAICENLRRMKADVEEFDDGFRVGTSNLKGAKIDSFGDHRIAMAFAVAGLFAAGETEILNADCVNVSFPDFFQVLEDVVR